MFSISYSNFEFAAHVDLKIKLKNNFFYIEENPSFFSRRIETKDTVRTDDLSLNFQDHNTYNELDSDVAIDLQDIVSKLDTFFIVQKVPIKSKNKTIFIVPSERMRAFNTRVEQYGGRVTELYFSRRVE